MRILMSPGFKQFLVSHGQEPLSRRRNDRAPRESRSSLLIRDDRPQHLRVNRAVIGPWRGQAHRLAELAWRDVPSVQPAIVEHDPVRLPVHVMPHDCVARR